MATANVLFKKLQRTISSISITWCAREFVCLRLCHEVNTLLNHDVTNTTARKSTLKFYEIIFLLILQNINVSIHKYEASIWNVVVRGSTALWALGPFIFHSSLSHSDTAHSIELLCTRDRSVTKAYTWQHTQHSPQIHIHVRCVTRNRNPIKRADTDSRLRPRGHWEGVLNIAVLQKYFTIVHRLPKAVTDILFMLKLLPSAI